MARAFLIISMLFALAVPATALGDDNQPPVPSCNDAPPPCYIIVEPGPPPPPDFIIAKFDGPIPLIAGPKQDITHIDPTYSRVAQKLSGQRFAQVRCWSKEDWSYIDPFFHGALAITGPRLIINPLTGDTLQTTGDKTQITHDVCARLDAMVYQRKRPSSSPQVLLDMATAVAVLVHESLHIKMQTDEGITQCETLKNIEKGGILLGLGKKYSHRLAEMFIRYGQGSMPGAYKNPKCGGGL